LGYLCSSTFIDSSVPKLELVSDPEALSDSDADSDKFSELLALLLVRVFMRFILSLLDLTENSLFDSFISSSSPIWFDLILLGVLGISKLVVYFLVTFTGVSMLDDFRSLPLRSEFRR